MDATHQKGALGFDVNHEPPDSRAVMIYACSVDQNSKQAHQSNPEYATFEERGAPIDEGSRTGTLWHPPR